MNTALARKWDYYDDDEEDLDDEPVHLALVDFEQETFEEDHYIPEEDEAVATAYLPTPSQPDYSYYRSAAYANYRPEYALPAPNTANQGRFGPHNAEAVYAYSYGDPALGRQSGSLRVGEWLANVTRNRLVVWLIMLGVGGFLLSNVLGWLSTRNVQAEIYSFSGVGGVVVSANGGASVAAAAPPGPVASGTHSVEGKPSISVAKIEEVLRQYNSPAVGTGQTLYDLGVKYRIDPAYALAFFVHESTAGTKGVAVTTKSLGNIRQTANSGFEGYQGFRKYPSWEAGMEDWYKLIRNLYIDGWNLRTVDAIIPKYAPAADRNNPPAYINQVNTMVDGWRNGK